MECIPSTSIADTVPPPYPTLVPVPSGSPKPRNCLICSTKIPASMQVCCNILRDSNHTTNASHKPLLGWLGNLLGIPLGEKAVRSHMVCKKCFELLNDVDKVEISLEAMKDDIRRMYKEKVEFWEKLENRQPDAGEDVEERVVKGNVCRQAQNQPEVETGACEGCMDGHSGDGDFDFDNDEKDASMSGADPPLEGNGRMKCPNCPRSFVWSKWLSDHMSTVHGDVLYACEVCLAEFDQGSSLQSHLREHEDKEDRFICFPCERSFQDLSNYQDHTKRHWCRKDGCLNAHMKVHQEEVTPAHGGKAFSNDHLPSHHQKAHASEPDYTVCQQCGRGFSSASSLAIHRMSVHTIDRRPFRCDSCGKTFTRRENYVVHLRTHTGERPFRCESCGRTFILKQHYVVHLRTHTGERPFQCEVCGVRFSQRTHLRSHQRAKHDNDRRYRCIPCNVGFMRRQLLVSHNNRVHTGERPYKCEQCKTAFICSDKYKKHLKIHTGEKPHKCEICGKAFKYRGNRNTHRFTHSDKKLYECKVCGKGYMRKPLIYAHMKAKGHLHDIIIVNQLEPLVDSPEKSGLSLKQYYMEVGQELNIEGLAVAEDDPGDSACSVTVDGLQLEAMEEAGDDVPIEEISAGPAGCCRQRGEG